ncbi:MAG: hypothetical protein QM718_09100 [Steroidobacteraceae bacterium]
MLPASITAAVSDSPRHLLLYLTANDEGRFTTDAQHFARMCQCHPGVERVEVLIVVSAVRPFSAADQRALDWLIADCAACGWLSIRAVIWKGNVGRDFSSAEAGLRVLAGAPGNGLMQPAPAAGDFVMVRNRSGYGPFAAGWYRAYVDQYQRDPQTALTGSTLCLRGHPRLASDPPWAHVQTYVYLSQWRHFAPLADHYPAARCVDRTELIVTGEIGLSRGLLLAGWRISCLHWPELAFDAGLAMDSSLPRIDFKNQDLGLPIRYKFKGYRRGLRAWRLRWRSAWREWRGQAPPQAALGGVMQRRCSDYD